MRQWVKYLIRKSFLLVFIGILTVMVLGGVIISTLESGAIAEGETPFWWAIVTMTTVGYGDHYPTTPAGRIFAVVVMFAGISLISLLTATISSVFVARKIREGKGLEKLDLTGHTILCGWNKSGDQILDSLQSLGRGPKLELVLVNDLSEDLINQTISRHSGLNIHFVSGDFSQEPVLERANLRQADTVLIIPNMTEAGIVSADEKTIFATLTIKGLEPNVRVVAYLTDRDNLPHIQRANADEVVVSDDFGAFLLASHVMDPGIPQTVNKLLDSRSRSHFQRRDIPAAFIGKPYPDLLEHFRQKDGTLLVGVYSEEENLGIGAILDADTSTLDAFIERKLSAGGISLQEESKINVVINPGRDYLLKEGERAIIIP